MTEFLPVPEHYDPDRVGELWRVPYGELAPAAEAWRREHRLAPASGDDGKTCLIAVDVQNTFCMPDFELFVAGREGYAAVEDNDRLCRFIYHNLHRITRILPTMDTHQVMQIFHSLFLVDDDGHHPDPMTIVSAEDIETGRWRFNREVAPNVGIDPDFGQEHLEHYARELARGGKYDLLIWPYHALLGGLGHALVPAVEEAIFFHTVARMSQADFHIKGRHPLTEHYSVLGPEVRTDPGGRELADKSDKFFESLRDYRAIIIAGQAKSHCVAWTIDDLLGDIRRHDPDLVRKVYLLEDCTSPVVVPGVVDFTEDATRAFERFAEAGMHIVKSTTPMSEWPGL